MREGYDGNAVQETAGKVSAVIDFSANDRLLREIRENGGEGAAAAMERLVEANTGLVKKIALRFTGRGVELDDLVQIGTIGLVKAIRSFDCERGTQLSTYAVPLIFGEIRRYLRDEGPIKVGRYYKHLGAQLMKHKGRILAEEGREAHITELARLCGVEVEEAAVAVDALSPIASLSDSAYGDEDGAELGDTIPDSESQCENERIIDRIALSQAISSMPVQWQKIVILRYYRDMTQQETADALCVTQVKISREEKKIMEYLRKEML